MVETIVSSPESIRLAKALPPPASEARDIALPDFAEPAPAAAGHGDESEDVFVFPATAAQRRFWLLDQLVPGGNPALHMPFAARLTGQLDVRALERAFQEVVRRHEALRTTFQCEQGQLRQIIAPSLKLSMPLVDVRDFPAAERARVPDHLAEEEAARVFDLARGPMVRARLIRLSDQEHRLLITVHHIVSDGWSNGVLLRELGTLYGAFVRGEPSPLPELPIQFADFAQWQQEHAETAADDSLAYWREVLAGELPVLDLPIDRPRRPVRGRAAAGAMRRITLPAPLAASLKALSVREGVSAYMLYLSVFSVLLSRYGGGQEDVLVNTPSANRDRRELEPLIGLFVNPLLLRLDLSGDPTFRELLVRARKVVLGAFDHANAPFERLVEELRPRRLQVNFLYQNNFLQAVRLPDLDLVPLPATSSVSLVDWSADVVEDGVTTTFTIEYNADLFEVATIDRVLAGYQKLLETVAAPGGPETAVSQLPLETVSEDNAAESLLVPDRRRLPTASVHWMNGCLTADAVTREGVRLLVLDRHLQPSPIGVIGEIYARGVSEDARRDLAALDWVEHPQGTLLKTGDSARRRSDGRIEWLGRVGDDGSVHGLRVDTAGIEAALQAHPHIRDAVVLWRERRDGVGGRRLIAYYQSDGAPAALFSHGQMREFLRETLPEDLVPAVFVPVERFPMTADGRLDLPALPEPPARTSGSDEKYDTPYLTIHHQLIAIWQEVLGVLRVSIRDDFFALGGNSLLAMRMLALVEQMCGQALLPATLFRQATIEGLADEMLQRGDKAGPPPEIVTVQEGGTKTPIFYLHGDLTGGGFYSMKLARQLGPDQPFYTLPPFEVADHRDLPSIEMMAAEHLRAIRSIRPHGPYVIGGFCLGGLVAHAVAQQMEAEGEQVERLLIIDSTVRNRRLKIQRRLVQWCARWRHWGADEMLYHFCHWHFLVARVKRWKRLKPREQFSILCRRLTGLVRKLLGRKGPAATEAPAGFIEPPPTDGEDGIAPPSARGSTLEGSWFDPRWDIPLVFLWATGGFQAKPITGPATLLLSHDLAVRGEGDENVAREWRRFLPHMDTYELAGSHLACITEHVDGLAETVRRCLAGTNGDAGTLAPAR